MSWSETLLERHLKEQLITDLGQEKANSKFSRYVVARDKVLNEIGQIAGVEPSLSDHGSKHIANVMENAHSLISNNHEIHHLSATDLYVLALVIVFHDVGNLFGREKHRLMIGEVYDWARGTDAEVRREKTLVIKAAQAHTGINSAGNRDTLSEVPQSDHLESRQVQLRSIAAILRLADELAEGPQRTTNFYRTQIGYEEDSKVFHQYAACTSVAADRNNERICITYDIQLNDFSSDSSLTQRRDKLTAFLDYILRRVAKLDDERRYARFYCPILMAFKQTDVAINFADGGTILPIEVRFQLDDLVVPGENFILFEKRFPGKCKTPADIAEDVFALAGKGGHSNGNSQSI